MTAGTSRSNSDFDVALRRNLVLPPKAAGFITDIRIHNSGYCIDSGYRYLYFKLNTTIDRVELTNGNYTGEELATELQTLLRTALAGLTTVNAGSQFYVQFQSAKNTLEYALAAQLNLAGSWTASSGRTYELTAGSDVTYSVAERVVAD